MSVVKIRERLVAFRATPASFAHALRLSLSEIVMEELSKQVLSQRELAEKSGMKEPFITRVLSGDQNWTTETAGRVLHALSVRGHIARLSPEGPDASNDSAIRDATTQHDDRAWKFHAEEGTQSTIDLRNYSVVTKAQIASKAKTGVL